MSELLLLSVDHRGLRRLYNRVLRGEQGALDEYVALWREFEHHDIACFVCDSEVTERPVFSLPVPDAHHASRAILLPLCAECAGLSEQLRWHRVYRILKAMWGVRFELPRTR
jgi:hypothetical protein